jgi:hypothetical protein
VRKRKCPVVVSWWNGPRWNAEGVKLVESYHGRKLPYCYAPALCAECFKKHRKALHADCPGRAAEALAKEVAQAHQAALDTLERGK